MAFADIYSGKRVLVTGHTGFKGAWLSEWLLALGAEVTGLALSPPTDPSLFDQLGLAGRLTDRRGDIKDPKTVQAVVDAVRPEFIFHLAAQPLVRLSYEQPVETYATNIMGTVHLLESVRRASIQCSVVIVTTDKCYENTERGHAYREDEPMGGHDPYSSSKGATELVVSAYRRSYFSAPDSPVRLATARAGNVIGGGDWALDRIIPDCIRALQRGDAIPVRNRHATRPWQHVLEPLSGYLWLAAKLAGSLEYATAFNFGPHPEANRPVSALAEEVLRHWPGKWEDRTDPRAVHEAMLLNLSIEKAGKVLGWRPVWGFDETVARTVEWYRTVWTEPAHASDLTRRQIAAYAVAGRTLNLPWAI